MVRPPEAEFVLPDPLTCKYDIVEVADFVAMQLTGGTADRSYGSIPMRRFKKRRQTYTDRRWHVESVILLNPWGGQEWSIKDLPTSDRDAIEEAAKGLLGQPDWMDQLEPEQIEYVRAPVHRYRVTVRWRRHLHEIVGWEEIT